AAKRRASATRSEFSSMAKRSAAATSARTGIDRSPIVESRSKIKLFAVGCTTAILLPTEIDVNSCNMKISETSGRQDRPTWHLKPRGSIGRRWVWLALVAALAWRCGGGGGGGASSSCSGPETEIQGLWSGPVTTDAIARGNPGTITANIFCTL